MKTALTPLFIVALLLFSLPSHTRANEMAWTPEESLCATDFHAYVSFFKEKKKFNSLVQLLEHELKQIDERHQKNNKSTNFDEIETKLYILDDLADIYTYGLVDFTKAKEVNAQVETIYQSIKTKTLKDLPVSSYFNNYRFLYYTFYSESSMLGGNDKMDFAFPEEFIYSIRQSDFEKVGKRIEIRTSFINHKLGNSTPAVTSVAHGANLDPDLLSSHLSLIDFSPEYSQFERLFLKAQFAMPVLHSKKKENPLFISTILQSNSTALNSYPEASSEKLYRLSLMNYWLVLAQIKTGQPATALKHHEKLLENIQQLERTTLNNYTEAERLLREYYQKELTSKNETRQNYKSLLSGLAKVGVIIAKAGLVIAGAAGDVAIAAGTGHAGTHLTEMAFKISTAGETADWGAGDAVMEAEMLSPLMTLDENNPERLKNVMSPYTLKLNRFFNKYDLIRYLSAVGDAYADIGEYEAAYEQYAEAITVVENQRITIRSESQKVSFFAFKQDLYRKMISSLIARQRPELALDYVERSKSRAFLDIIAGQDVQLKNSVQNDLSNKYTMNRMVVDSFYEKGSTSNDQVELLSENMRGIKKISTEIDTNEVQEIFSLSNINALPSQEIQRLVDPGTAILEYYVFDDRIVIFTIKNSGITYNEKKIEYKELCRDINKFRNSLSKKEYGKSLARKLYKTLLKPVKNEIKNCKRLIIIPHRALHYIPFHALRSRKGYVVFEHAISYSPSATVLSIVENKKSAENDSALIIGNPTENLPYAEKEALTIAKRIQNSTVAIGSNGTETMIKEDAENYKIIHIATHGVFNPEEPLKSQLLLGADDKNDGKLLASEIFSCKWKASLVTLSACETGASLYNSGDELIGLQRAVFFAGTKSLLASSWKVDDKSTGYLMGRFYKHLAKNPKDRALQKAQIDTLRKYGRPFHWASFKLMGSPRRVFNPEYRVTINTTPDDSKVVILGTPKRNGPYLRLPSGDYDLKISHKGYKQRNATMTIGDEDEIIRIRPLKKVKPAKSKADKKDKDKDIAKAA